MMYEILIRGAIGGLGKLRRRQRPHPPRNAPRIDGHPAGRCFHHPACAAAEEDAVGLKASQLPRTAQRAVGQESQLVRVEVLCKLRKPGHRPRLHDQHRQAASVLPQAVAGVDQGGKVRAEPVLLQGQLYVPAEADMPPAPQYADQGQQSQRRHGQVAPRSAAAGCGAAPAHKCGHAHAERRLQHAPGAKAAGEQRGGDQAGCAQGDPVAQPAQAGEKGEDGIEAEQKQRAKQPAQMQPSQCELHRGEDAGVHQQIYGQNSFQGHPAHLAFHVLSYGKSTLLPRIDCR